MPKPFLLFICLLLGGFELESCSKHPSGQSSLTADSLYGTRSLFVLQDNFTFSSYYYILGLTNWTDTLSAPGPYTVLVPENAGFYSNGWEIYDIGEVPYFWTPSYINDFIRYSIVNGRYSMDSLPLGDNQVLPASQGFHFYISKYLQGNDTLVSVNGAVISGVDIPTANGLIEALSAPINPEENLSLITRIENDNNLTMFAAALQRVHADTLLSQAGPWTVLAPSNTAFIQSAWEGKGLSTMDSLLSMDTSVLGPLVRNHIIKGRYFINDFTRQYSPTVDTLKLPTAAGEPAYVFLGQEMMYGPTEQVFLGGSESGTPGGLINLDNGNYFGDIPAGNGVLQEIDQVLIP